jgi:hypothetical protein
MTSASAYLDRQKKGRLQPQGENHSNKEDSDMSFGLQGFGVNTP